MVPKNRDFNSLHSACCLFLRLFYLMRLHANNTLDTQVHAAISSIYFLRRVTSDKPEVLGLAATP